MIKSRKSAERSEPELRLRSFFISGKTEEGGRGEIGKVPEKPKSKPNGKISPAGKTKKRPERQKPNRISSARCIVGDGVKKSPCREFSGSRRQRLYRLLMQCSSYLYNMPVFSVG